MSLSFKPASSAVGVTGGHRELARRSSAGVDVTLSWHPILDELIVCVCDKRHGTHFEIRPQSSLALDVYYHPYAYAYLEGVYAKEDRRAGRS
jgi:hypothetical protein